MGEHEGIQIKTIPTPGADTHPVAGLRRRLLYAAMALSPALATAGDAGPVIEPAEWDFGQIPVDSSSTPTRFELFNQGSASLTVSEVSLGSDAFGLTADECTGTVLAAGETCGFDIHFEPQQPGKYISTANVVTDAAPEPMVVGLSGEGTTPYLELLPETLDFDVQAVGTSSSAQTLTLSNAGQKTLEVSAISGPDAPFDAIGGDCPAPPFSLESGDDCYMALVFAPADSGDYSETLTVESNSYGGATSATLSGTGEHLPPALTIEPVSIDFGAIHPGGTDLAMLTVRNTGTLSLNDVSVSPPAVPFQTSPGSCGSGNFDLDGGENCQLEIYFQPDSTGAFAGEMALSSSNGGDGTVPLQGRGEIPASDYPIPTLSRLALWLMASLVALIAILRFR